MKKLIILFILVILTQGCIKSTNIEETSKAINETESNNSTEIFVKVTPDIYFGYITSKDQLGNEERWEPERTVKYAIPDELEKEKFYLKGNWMNNRDNMNLESQEGSIVFLYDSKEISLTAYSKKINSLTIYIDGKRIKNVEISKLKEYNIINNSDYKPHTMQIDINSPDLRIYHLKFK